MRNIFEFGKKTKNKKNKTNFPFPFNKNNKHNPIAYTYGNG